LLAQLITQLLLVDLVLAAHLEIIMAVPVVILFFLQLRLLAVVTELSQELLAVLVIRVVQAVRLVALVTTQIRQEHLVKVIKAARLQIRLTMAQLWVVVVALARLAGMVLPLLAVTAVQERRHQ
jgi:hypothetical protein